MSDVNITVTQVANVVGKLRLPIRLKPLFVIEMSLNVNDNPANRSTLISPATPASKYSIPNSFSSLAAK